MLGSSEGHSLWKCYWQYFVPLKKNRFYSLLGPLEEIFWPFERSGRSEYYWRAAQFERGVSLEPFECVVRIVGTIDHCFGQVDSIADLQSLDLSLVHPLHLWKKFRGRRLL